MMETLHREIINTMQGGFPLCHRPFDKVAEALGLSGERLIDAVSFLLKQGYLTRFGPLFNAERFGGGLTLAAMSVPDDAFEQTVTLVNGFSEVAHNYARDHHYNMWFVVATEKPQQVSEILGEIENRSGFKVLNMPKLREFHLGFKIHIGDQGMDTAPIQSANTGDICSENVEDNNTPDTCERTLIHLLQEGLPLISEPYRHVAQRAGLADDDLLERLETMLRRGWIRRIGVVPNHYRLGLRGNGMTVWELPEEEIERLGTQVGAMSFVSHCYHRPTYLPSWPYNLFAMVHGGDRDVVVQKTASLFRSLAPHVRRHEILFSSRILKKTGIRISGGCG